MMGGNSPVILAQGLDSDPLLHGLLPKRGVSGCERATAFGSFGFAEDRRLGSARPLPAAHLLRGYHLWVAPAVGVAVGEGSAVEAQGHSRPVLHSQAQVGGRCLFKLRAIQPTEHRGFQTYFLEEAETGNAWAQGPQQDRTSAPR